MSLMGVLALVVVISIALLAFVVLLAWGIRRIRPDFRHPEPGSPLKSRNIFWPKLSRPADAQASARNVARLYFLIAGVYVLLVAIAAMGRAALGDALLFALIGAGLLRCSRVAAIFGIALYVAEQLWVISNGGIPNPISLLYVAAFVTGIRASFAYHSLRASVDA